MDWDMGLPRRIFILWDIPQLCCMSTEVLAKMVDNKEDASNVKNVSQKTHKPAVSDL